MSWQPRSWVGPLVVLGVLSPARPALAGPPFLCHRFDIGSARSLPWGEQGWSSGKQDYNLASLVADTQALLQPSTPVIVRMETLRRATLYARRDPKIAKTLLMTFFERARTPDQAGQWDGLAWFDAGYLAEAFRETESLGDISTIWSTSASLASFTGTIDPRALMQKSLALRPGDPSIEFALALIVRGTERRERGQKARAGAPHNALLAHNIHLFLD